MTIKAFWIILIKVVALWILLSSLTNVPQFFYTLFADLRSGRGESLVNVISMMVLTLAINFFALWLLAGKTEWLINKLKLDIEFADEKIDLNVSFATFLRLAIIVFGGFLFVDGLPGFCRHVFLLLEEKYLFRSDPQSSWMIFYLAKIIIGYLLMTNSRQVATFINKQKTDEITADE